MKGCGRYFCFGCGNVSNSLEFNHKEDCSLKKYGISICGEDKDEELCEECVKNVKDEVKNE